MKKRQAKKKVTRKPVAGKLTEEQQEIRNELEIVQNGLSQAILGFNPSSIGTEIQQVDTLFVNNRWYLISNMRQILSEIYVEHGLVQTIVDVPVEDAFRGGIKITSKQLSTEDIEKLQIVLDREGDMTTVAQAFKWNRLFGGAGIVILTNQDYHKPLNVAKISKDEPLGFRAVDMWELFWDKQNTEGYNPELQAHDFVHFDYYGKKVHKTRVMKMNGIIAPSFVRPRLRGWGISVIEALVSSINQYLKANNLIFEVLDEFKIDIYKIKNLTNTLLSKNGTSKIQQRIQLANQQKNFQSAIVMDREDDYTNKELNFAGISEAMDGIRMKVASDMRMPMTKLFGISSAGFSSGEDDIENYNAMIESSVRQPAKKDILKVIELRCQSIFGFVPEDLEIEFKPLRILGGEAEENVKTAKYNRLLAALQSGAISTKEFKEAVNKDNLLGIKLDTSIELIDMGPEDVGAEGGKGINVRPQTEGAKVPTPRNPISVTQAPVATNSSDQIPGGLADKKKPSDFDPKQLAEGHRVEMEHTTDHDLAREIAMDHLAEDPDYYRKLKKVENTTDIVACVGLLCDGYILTGKRHDNGKWTFPAGHAEVKDGDAVDTAVRETWEESGIGLKRGMLKAMPSEVNNGKKIYPFLAKLSDRLMPRTTLDPDVEVKQWKWVPISNNTPELQVENRHVENDAILNILKKNGAMKP